MKRQELQKQLDELSGDDKVVIWSKMKPTISKSSRGSKYRGVSKNGKKWQVQLLGNLRKRYIGSISSEQEAAKLYDYYAILTHGLNAKTNFSYSKAQVQNFVQKFDQDDILAPSYLKMKMEE